MWKAMHTKNGAHGRCPRAMDVGHLALGDVSESERAPTGRHPLLRCDSYKVVVDGNRWEEGMDMAVDRRVARSKHAIRTAFLELASTEGVEGMTVSELCRKADIGRGTFYLHYRDVRDLYDSIETELADGLGDLFVSCYPSTDPANGRRLADGLTAYVEGHADVLLVLIRHGGGHILRRIQTQLDAKVIAESRSVGPQIDTGYAAVESVFAVSGMIGVLEEWITGGMEIPRPAIADMLDVILRKINR